MSSSRRFVFSLFSLACVAGAALAGSAGCAHNNPERVEVSYHYLEERDIHRSFTDEGLLLEEYDINSDGEIDNWTYSQPLSKHGEPIPLEDLSQYSPTTLPSYRLLRRELDINFDGSLDIIRHYDAQGKVAKDEVDSDFNGKIDRVVQYSKGVITRRSIDADEDGYFEEIRHFIKGKLFRVEKDTNNDGQTNYWQFFDEGVLSRAGFDHDGDRIIDEWLQAGDLARARQDIQKSEEEEKATLPEEP